MISVLIPTRDRPELFELCLRSLESQNANFEVIVADNFTRFPVKNICDSFNDKLTIKYFHPDTNLDMSDNWEYAYQQSSGELIVTLIDKTVLIPGALAALENAAKESDAEIFSWWSEYFVPLDGVGRSPEGFCSPQYNKGGMPCEYSTQDCYQSRVSFKTSIADEGVRYFHAKPCFGAYKRSLTEKIVRATGRLFHPISPDFTTTVFALIFSSKIYDFGRPFLISVLSSLSNGMQFSRSASYAKELCRSADVEAYGSAPISGLYSSAHNIIAADYVLTLAKVERTFEFNAESRERFLKCVVGDLSCTLFSSRKERRDQFLKLKFYAKEHYSYSAGLKEGFDLAYPRAERILDFLSAAFFGLFDSLSNRKVLELKASQDAERTAIYDAVYKRFLSPLSAATFLSEYYSNLSD